jgi:hypothetical protein
VTVTVPVELVLAIRVVLRVAARVAAAADDDLVRDVEVARGARRQSNAGDAAVDARASWTSAREHEQANPQDDESLFHLLSSYTKRADSAGVRRLRVVISASRVS